MFGILETGGAPAVVAAAPVAATASAAPAATAAAPPMTPAASVMPAPSAAPPMATALAPVAPSVAVAAPAAGDPALLMAMTECVKKFGGEQAKAIVIASTNTWPDGDPKKGSTKYQDIPPQFADWVKRSFAAGAPLAA